jgi:hypothetical protein
MFWGLPAEHKAEFAEAVKTIARAYPGKAYASDMLITLMKNASFFWEERFIESVKSIALDDEERSIAWRLHTTTWAARHALNIEGDFVECGVYRGFTAGVICRFLDFTAVAPSKTFYLYDTFRGLPEETSTAAERGAHPQYQRNDDGAALVEFVRVRFAPYPNVRIVQGIVPHSFEQAAPERIAFLHIDMNSVQAEMGALERLFDRVTPGGLIILDDFGWTPQVDQAVAQTQFMRQRGHFVLELPTGQGMVVKH